MAEPTQPTTPPEPGWTADAVKQYVDEKIVGVERAVDVAREGIPPHVTIQDYFEMLLNEREKAVQLALNSADKLERERIARVKDAIAAEVRVATLTRELSDTAITKAEAASNKQFTEFASAVREQMTAMTDSIEALTRRVESGLGG